MKKLLPLTALLLSLMLPISALAETVVTSFFPIYVFALNLTQDLPDVEVVSLAPPSAGCLHDYQLQTSDMKALSQADVFLINGAGMESYLTHVFEAFPELPVVDASVGVTLLESCLEHDHDHGEDAETDDGHHHETNAHIWLDAENAILMVENLAEGLMAQLPRHADAIAANRDTYIARLSALDAELLNALAGLPHSDVITFHEAFPYFANAYGLHVAAVLNHEPEDALSPRTLAELCITVQELGNPPLFIEPQYEDTAARTVSRETGAPVYVLDPIVTGPEGDVPLTWYEDVMRQNLAVLLDALGE
nr:zinc ABC transporter substrate-binding protein [Clostridia bacterium]